MKKLNLAVILTPELIKQHAEPGYDFANCPCPLCSAVVKTVKDGDVAEELE